MPILRTIHGRGLFEGGSFALLNGTTAVAGGAGSFRQNEEAARQIEEVLVVLGIRLLRLSLPDIRCTSTASSSWWTRTSP